jgi:nucleoside 2-deoxyribosyltransferase
MTNIIYLAGPITGLSWKDATEWREDLVNRYNDISTSRSKYVALSPLRGKHYLKNETEIKDSYSNFLMSTAKAVNSRDMFDVSRSNLIIVNLLNTTKISIGTVLEIGAAFALKKPIITIIEPPSDQFSKAVNSNNFDVLRSNTNIHYHSMLVECSTLICHDINTAFDLSIHFLG